MNGAYTQIVAKNKDDRVFYTNPEITFFKTRLPRHSAFSIDLFEENFNRIPNFGEEAFCNLSKFSDLICDMFLKIEIPSVKISKNEDIELLSNFSENIITSDDFSLKIDEMIEQYDLKINNFKKFSKSSMKYWRNIKDIITGITTNYTTVQTLINTLETAENDEQSVYSQYNEFSNVKIGKTKIFFNFDILNKIKTGYTSYSNSIYNKELTSEYKNKIETYLNFYIKNQITYIKYLIDTRDKFIKIKNEDQNLFYRFSWVEKLGCAIIENLTFSVGGRKYDYFEDVILENKFELTLSKYKKKLLNKMLGNVKSLTTYDSNDKPSYTLLIPLPLWFTKYKQQSYSVISSKYQDLEVFLKLKNLRSCCYFEGDFLSDYDSNINIEEIIKIKNVSLYVYYVNLTEQMRKKYANNEFETLIELSDSIQINNIKNYDVLMPLELNSTIKEFHWIYRKDYNVEELNIHFEYTNHDIFPAMINIVGQQDPYYGKMFVELTKTGVFSNKLYNHEDYRNGYVEISYSKYYNGFYKILMVTDDMIVINSSDFVYPDVFLIKLFDINKKPIELVIKENPLIYGTGLVSLRDSNFYTLVMQDGKYNGYNHGIRSYVFSRNVEEFQPSGSLNFGIIKNKKIQTFFNHNLINQAVKNGTTFLCNISATTYNFLRFSKGYSQLLYK